MKITKKQIQAIMDEYIQREERSIKEHEEIIEILTPLDGKPINRQTLNEKRLNGFKIKVIAGMTYLDKEFSHLVGYASDPFISVEKFKRFDLSNGTAAKERIDQIKNLDINQLLRLYGGIEKHFEALRVLFGDIEREDLGSYHNPIYCKLFEQIYDGKANPHRSEQFDLSSLYYIRK